MIVGAAIVNSRQARRGFALLTVMLTAAIVAAAVLAFAQLVRADVRRTFDQRSDAQRRQLLFAGELAAREALTSRPGERRVAVELELPPSLAESGGRAAIAGDVVHETATFVVTVAYAGRSAEQQLRYTRASTGWQLVSVTLK